MYKSFFSVRAIFWWKLRKFSMYGWFVMNFQKSFELWRLAVVPPSGLLDLCARPLINMRYLIEEFWVQSVVRTGPGLSGDDEDWGGIRRHALSVLEGTPQVDPKAHCAVRCLQNLQGSLVEKQLSDTSRRNVSSCSREACRKSPHTDRGVESPKEKLHVCWNRNSRTPSLHDLFNQAT